MEEARHLSLWLSLEGEASARASALIEELARAHGTPAFVPHVTVLGRLEGRGDEELQPTLRRVAEESVPFTIRLTHLESQPVYHRALYAVAEAPELFPLHARAAAAFGVLRDESYRPHLSLLYGELPDSVKEHILDRMDRRFDLTFEAHRLELWATGGHPESWRRIRVVSLSKVVDFPSPGTEEA